MLLARVNWVHGSIYLAGLVAVWEAFREAEDREDAVLSCLELLGRWVEERPFRVTSSEELYKYFSDALYSWEPYYVRFFGDTKRSLWETAVRMGDLYWRLQGGEPWVEVMAEAGVSPGPEVYAVGRVVEETRWAFDPFGQVRRKPTVPTYEEYLARLGLAPSGGAEASGQAPEAGAPSAGAEGGAAAEAPRPVLPITVKERVEPEGGVTLEIGLPAKPKSSQRGWYLGEAMRLYLPYRGDDLYHVLLGAWAEAFVKLELWPQYGSRLRVKQRELVEELKGLWWKNLLLAVQEREGFPDDWAAYTYLMERGLTDAEFTENYLRSLLISARAYVEERSRGSR